MNSRTVDPGAASLAFGVRAPRRAAVAFEECRDGRPGGRVAGIRRAGAAEGGGGGGGRVHRANGLDRWIARFSRLSMPRARWRSRLTRRIVYALAWLRRESL